MKVCKREWVEANSAAFSALIQQHYLVVPKSARRDRAGKRWVQMQKMIDEPEGPMTPAPEKWRVTYPGITQDLTREFDDEGAANRFAETRRNATGRYSLPNDWRHVKVERIA